MKSITTIAIVFLPLVLWGEETHHLNTPKYFHVSEGVSSALTIDWNSRYFLEGRDLLGGEGIWGTTVELACDSFEFAGWLGASDGARYEELNLFTAYHFEAAGLNWYASYMHLQFLSDEFDDNELGAGFETPELALGVVGAMDWYYSLDANGSFITASLSRPIETCQDVVVTPALIFGRNDGYISSGHNGANHLGIQLAVEWPINDRVSLSAFAEQSLAIDSDAARFADDASLQDSFFGGLAITLVGP